jgi:hypothetical protein
MHAMLPTLQPLPDASALGAVVLERYPSGLRVREAKRLITPSAGLD